MHIKQRSNRRQLLKGAGGIAIWSTPIVQSILLPAHAQTSTGAITSLTTLANWHATPDSQPIVSRGVINVQLDYTNISASSIVFPASDSDTIQVWTTPSVDDPNPVFSVSPAGSTVAINDSYSYRFTIDFSVLADTETGLAFRPRSTTLGTMSPTNARLDSVLITE
ncbi:hypothetical protein [Arenicella xantha]|uniref:Uncharacterized protein n=1 Tax=Arenicella xantha TaxID=644221 RepID=A0A395JEP6_9GAMM|nr:hypothetical protein [Arenicella xantha]RBP47114.1 hypothetical protein DFR28_11077 [Arenicella xantha]